MNQKARELIHELRYQMAAGVHTYGQCSMPRCTHTARGSAHCEHCVQNKLAKQVGTENAQRLRNLFYKLMSTQSDIDEFIGEL